jgi:hypothetical protein
MAPPVGDVASVGLAVARVVRLAGISDAVGWAGGAAVSVHPVSTSATDTMTVLMWTGLAKGVPEAVTDEVRATDRRAG